MILNIIRRGSAAMAIVAIIGLSVAPTAFAQTVSDTSTDSLTDSASVQAQTTTNADDTFTYPSDRITTPAASTTDETTTSTDASTTDDTSVQADATTTIEVPAMASQARTEGPPPQYCLLASDTTTYQNGHPAVLVSSINSLWTASQNNASWIWGEDPVADPVNGGTETFTKYFTMDSVPTNAFITIAADNSYEASVNGIQFASDPSEFNYTADGQDSIAIPASDFHVGLNTFTFTVHNFPHVNGTEAINPAGLMYTFNALNTNCASATPPAPTPAVTVVATKVICDEESLLPNWGMGGHTVDATTAAEYVASHPGCHLAPNWQFEWGNQNVGDAGDSFIGPAGNGYTTFGPTNASGTAQVTIPLTDNLSAIGMREVLQPGYIPFTYDEHRDNSDSVSAEFYCQNDVLNYDNLEFLRNLVAGQTYNCVAFNAPVQTVSTTTPITPTTNASLTIVDKTTGGDGTFNFTVGLADGETTVATTSVTTTGGTGSTTLSLPAGTNLNVFETLPTSWQLNNIVCVQDASTTLITPTLTFTDIAHIYLSAGINTTCTFNTSLTSTSTTSTTTTSTTTDTTGGTDTSTTTTATTTDTTSTTTTSTGSTGGSSGGGGGFLGESAGSSIVPQVLGASTTTQPVGQVLGASCGLLLPNYLKMGWKNNSTEVTALQTFLNGEVGTMLPTTGFFGSLTKQAVRLFQKKYGMDVLSPWVGIPASGIKNSMTTTGFVYKTTQWKINMIHCPDLNLPFPTLP